MYRQTLTIGRDDPARFAGAVLCRDLILPDGGGTLRRGATLDDRLLARLATAPGIRVTVVVPEPGELEQGEASRRIAAAISGAGVRNEAPHQGQVIVRASSPGLARIDPIRVAAINRRGSVLLATSLDGRVAQPDDLLAVVKAAQLWVSAAEVAATIADGGDQAVLRVAPFTVRDVAFLAGERIRPANVAQAIPHLQGAIVPFGARLTAWEHLVDHPDAIAAAYRQQLERGAEIILVAGSIVLDPEDPYLLAVEELGGRIVCRGAPIDPGTMFWVGEVGASVFLGLASCELYGRLSILDLILPYALARESITPDLFAQLGYGGLLEQTYHARR